jgi:hypothetical protein
VVFQVFSCSSTRIKDFHGSLLRHASVEESDGHLLLHIDPQQRILELLESKNNCVFGATGVLVYCIVCSYPIWNRPCSTGLPDFSGYNIPKREKYTKRPHNLPNRHKIYQLAVKYMYPMAIKYTIIFH